MDWHKQYEELYKEALELKARGQLTEAASVEAKAARLLEELAERARQNPADPQTATDLLFLAEREWPLLGDHPSVQEKIAQALAVRESKLGMNDLSVAEAAAKLGEFHFLAGRLGDAEPLYRRAAEIYEKRGKTKDENAAHCFGGLAQTLAALGRLQEADIYFVRAVEHTGPSEEDQRALYFLLIYRAEGLEKLNRQTEAAALRAQAAALLPKSNPGEQGFHV